MNSIDIDDNNDRIMVPLRIHRHDHDDHLLLRW